MRMWGILLVVFVSATVLVSKAVKADVSLSWFDISDTPSLSLDSTSVSAPKTTYWGAPCRDESFTAVYRDAHGAKTNQDITQCVSRGSYGHLSTYGLLFDGTSTSHRVYSSTGALLSLYPIPNTKHVFTTGYESNIYKYLYIYKDLPTHVVPVEVDSDVERYQTTEPHNAVNNRILLPDGYQAVVQDQTLVYSQNGQYIFANMGRAQVLIDVDAQTARILGDRTNHSSGAPKVKLAVNSDASLVFVGDNNTGSYKIYDTTNCTVTTASNPEVCPVRDISSLVNSVPNKRQLGHVRFIDDGKLEFIMSVNANSGMRGDRYILTAPGYHEPSLQYLALGDSFASGEGAYDYRGGTDVEGNNCHISTKSYKYLIADELIYSAAESVACSGAKMKDIYINTTNKYSEFTPQASGRVNDSFDEEIFSNYLPGYRWQYEFVERYKPDAITLSISGNDINFGKKLQYCILTQYNCFESAEQKAGILKEIKAQFTGLAAVYKKIREVSPDTRVYVIGYPSLALPGGDCALNVRLSEAELTLADEIVEDLNTMIKRAAAREGMFFVDTTDAFSGHRLCEGAPGSTAVNGLTFGTDQPFGFGPVSSATYHPNKLGHELFAETILQHTSNLTADMPTPDESVSTKDMPSRLNPTDTDYPDVGTPILEDGLFGELVKIGDSAASLIQTAGYYLRAGDTFTAEIHSEPTVIGSATALDSETLQVNAVMPTGVEPGAHTVHLYGENIAGEPIDIYKSVVVIASDTDYDGDGIPNESDQCMFVDASGTDSDGDGVDDGCDAEISETIQPPEDRPQHPGEVHGRGHDGTQQNRLQGLFSAIVTRISNTLDRVETLVNRNKVGHAAAKSRSEKRPTDKKQQNPDSSDWRKTALILLTSTPFGVAMIILLDL